MRNALGHAAPELVNSKTGRLDSEKVAEYLHLRASDLAEITGHSARYVREKPDASSLQAQLEKVAGIVSGLFNLTGGVKEQMLIWLNAPHPVLDHESPLDLMRGQEVDVVVDLVDDMLSGAPA